MSVLVARDVRVAGRLASVSLSIAKGEVHALVGPNGSGKSTFLDCVLGLIHFEGTLELAADVRLAVVPQRFSVPTLTPMTVLELLAASRSTRPSFLGIGAATRAEVERALSRTAAEALLNRRVSELSGGELRRVLLADALATKPQLLLLDEPEAGLDDASKQQLATALEQARRDGVATLLISHDAQAITLATHTTRLGSAA